MPFVILPPPSAIVARDSTLPILWGDFVQTVVKGALSGYVMGCGGGPDRHCRRPFDFLQRGLLPVGNFVAALPIVGTAPILVMWFGFDWQSKAAVVVVMVFFPMLVNTVAGPSETDGDAARPDAHLRGQLLADLFKLRLPAAMPFVFNGLKISSTLALIGAIVAEFFGSPTRAWAFASRHRWGSLRSTWSGPKLPWPPSSGIGLSTGLALMERG